MVRIALQLGGPALVALGQDTLGEAAVGDGRGVEERLAWGDLLGRPHVRDDLLVGKGRPGACGQPGERHAGAQELEEVAAFQPAIEWCCLPRELLVQELPELVGLGELSEAAPVRRALLAGEPLAYAGEVARFVSAGRVHLWQVEHWMSLSVSMWYASISSVPIARLSSGSEGNPYSMLRTSLRGRSCVAGSRWHSRHQPIVRGSTLVAVTIWSTRPWQLEQPTPLFTCTLWSK